MQSDSVHRRIYGQRAFADIFVHLVYFIVAFTVQLILVLCVSCKTVVLRVDSRRKTADIANGDVFIVPPLLSSWQSSTTRSSCLVRRP